MKTWATILAGAALALVSPMAFADDGGADDASACVDDAGNPCDDGGADAGSSVPLACDGALCDTTNGAECGVSPGAALGASPVALFVAAVLGASALLRRARRGKEES